MDYVMVGTIWGGPHYPNVLLVADQGLDRVQLFVNLHHVWCCGMKMLHEVNDTTAERFCDLGFVDQETARDAFVAQYSFARPYM
ncbi:hypothetical protein TNCV_1690731 [Trichonephila clavipes]|nr:hypothetical protein TNCV_1690731 [Trichonephila clavipes]